ncbi:unnamed protein product [Meloidogyne enterolobii]|uniref:Uncharacterized protein n=1 Tax=Meloidogyne enterolobii TaxID=390850 RepID=A0ACB0Y5E6_MELEN
MFFLINICTFLFNSTLHNYATPITFILFDNNFRQVLSDIFFIFIMSLYLFLKILPIAFRIFFFFHVVMLIWVLVVTWSEYFNFIPISGAN